MGKKKKKPLKQESSRRAAWWPALVGKALVSFSVSVFTYIVKYKKKILFRIKCMAFSISVNNRTKLCCISYI